MLPLLLGIAALSLIAIHLASLAITWWRCRPRPLSSRPADAATTPPITVVRPLCGIESFSAETLAATFTLDYPRYEILFCVASAADPITPLVEHVLAAHPAAPARLLVGDDRIGVNPKLNNMVKGWRHAAHDWIIFIDSNVLVPPDFLRQAMAAFRDDTGVVSAPPCGIRPQSIGACLECAFLNTFEARWQYVVDTLGSGFAQGKTLFYRKADLDRSGMRELASEPAEDAATTKMVRRYGKRVRLARLSPQPLGVRRCRDVWDRQLRWARMRRATFPLEFLPEILSGSVVPTLVAVAALATGGLSPLWLGLWLLIWYAGEAALARACGWPSGPTVLAALVGRDLLLPVLYVGAFTSRSFTWQGNTIDMGKRDASALPEPGSTPLPLEEAL